MTALEGTPSTVDLFEQLQDIQQQLNALAGTKHTHTECNDAASALEAENFILGGIQKEKESTKNEESNDNGVPPPAQCHCPV